MSLSSLSWPFILHPASMFCVRCPWSVYIRWIMTPSRMFFIFIWWFTFWGRVVPLVFRFLFKFIVISFSFSLVFKSLTVFVLIIFTMIMPSFSALALLWRRAVIRMAFLPVFLFFFGFLFFFTFLFLCFFPILIIFFITIFGFLGLLKAFSCGLCIFFLWMEVFIWELESSDLILVFRPFRRWQLGCSPLTNKSK